MNILEKKKEEPEVHLGDRNSRSKASTVVADESGGGKGTEGVAKGNPMLHSVKTGKL